MNSKRSTNLNKSYDSSEIRLVIFDCQYGDSDIISLGIDAMYVREIIEPDKITPLPTQYLPFIGVLDLRGIPIPTLSIEHILIDSQQREVLNKGQRVIICEIKDKLIGILVGEKVNIEMFQHNSIFPPEFLLLNKESSYINGIARDKNGNHIYLLDLTAMPFI